MTRRTVHHVVAEAARVAGIEFPVHPHMLRHATGFYLANAGQDTRAIQLYLGHKNIQHTVRYTELAAGRFKDFFEGLTNRTLPSDGGSRGRLEITTLTMRPQFAASKRSSRDNELRSNYQSLSSRFIAGTWKTL